MALFARLARERQVASTLPSSNEVSPVDAQPSYLWSAPPATAQPTRLADATPRAAPVAPRPYAQAPVQSQQPRPMIPHPYQEVRARVELERVASASSTAPKLSAFT